MPPLARTEGVLVERLAEEVMVYDLHHNDIHCLNRVAAWVWQQCDGETPVEELGRAAAEALEVPVDADLVWLALEELEAARLLAAPVRRAGAPAVMSRREVARKLGLAGASLALALPIITTLGAPTPLQAASSPYTAGSQGDGDPCVIHTDCSGTLCCHNSLKICRATGGSSCS